MLAIIIPYYKFTFFEATLESLANQTDKRFKVYIGDDASPENSNWLLEKYNEKFNLVYQRFEQNLGGVSLTQQWERCIAFSGDEEWVMILGDDDVLGENVVAEFYNNLSEIIENHINVIRFSTYKINEIGKQKTSLYTHPKIESSKDFFFKRRSRSSLSEYVFNKQVVKKIKFKNFPLAWYSDYLAILEFSNFGNIFTINNAFVKIRVSTSSISGSGSFNYQKDKARVAYYGYLLTHKKMFFNKQEIKELFWMLNKTYLNNKKNIYLLFEISIVYIRNRFITDYFVFIMSIMGKRNNLRQGNSNTEKGYFL